jgi:hypothetical protein
MAALPGSTQRIQNSLNSYDSVVIRIDLTELGNRIHDLIVDVGQLYSVAVGDLIVFKDPAGAPPADVREAIRWGTKFFDAIYFFALDAANRPNCQDGVDIGNGLDGSLETTKKRLFWAALFLMIRGSYPSSPNAIVGADIPNFIANTCGMNCTPHACSDHLSSFDIRKVNPVWIKSIDWSQFAQPIRQRLALGLSGYRMLAPFKIYTCQPGVNAGVQAAYAYARAMANAPPDYALLSCTRSPAATARFGSLNKALGNLILECFSAADIAEMVNLRIIYAAPVHDRRHDTWTAWVAGGALAFTDPIGL